MQDWNYLQCETLEITVEMGCNKFPMENELLQKYYDHYIPLVEHIKNARQGFWGKVTDSAGSAIDVSVEVEAPDIGINITTRPDGRYWRVAAPGEYEVTFTASGYKSHVHHVTVRPVDWASLPDPVNVNLFMENEEIANHVDTIDRESRADMLTRRYIVVSVVVVLVLAGCVMVGLWRRKKQREDVRRQKDIEYRGLINEESDSE